MRYHLKIVVGLLLLWLAPPLANGADLDLVELIAAIKKAIAEAEKADKKSSMIIPWIEAEISYTIKKDYGGGVRISVITVEGKHEAETVHRIKFRLQPPKGKTINVMPAPDVPESFQIE